MKQNPLSVSPTELNIIKEFVKDQEYKNFPLVTVYYEMMRKGKAFMSLTTFYKYAKLFDNVAKRRLFKAKQKKGIRAAKPKEIIHADVCVYRPLDNTKAFIYFIIDNFSRMILGWRISTQYNSSIMLDNLRRQQLPDLECTRRFLETAVKQYNNRPHSALFGLTPHEVFYGVPPNKQLFKPQIELAKALRKAENKALNCDNCAFTIDKQD